MSRIAFLALARLHGTPAHGFPYRFNRFWASLRHEHQGTTLVTESLAQLTREVFLVRLGKQFIAIHEQQEGRRRLAHLRGVKELQPMPHAADGLAALHGV